MDIFAHLTPSQQNIAKMSSKLICHFKTLIINGDSSSGKFTTVKALFTHLNADVVPFDLCELAAKTDKTLSNQHLIEYLDYLISKFNPSTSLGIIYFRHYNNISDTLTDCYARVRYLLPLILKSFIEKLPNNIRIVITTQGFSFHDNMAWSLKLETCKDDMQFILNPYIGKLITSEQSDEILKITKIVPVGKMLYCLRYANAMLETKPFVESYRTALNKISTGSIDVDKDVPCPILEEDLVGMEHIIDEVITSIINPMKLSIPGIPIKRGLLLCGPPGTGKTSIGRWLAHQIKGKFYLIGGQCGINGPSLIDSFDITISRAKEHAPAVVFIDDCDVLFERDDTYRAFLTILDGIETNKRADICVILTCMNLRTIPSSLLRGGRLEMALVTRLPDRANICKILQRGVVRLEQTLREYSAELGDVISRQITDTFISNISLRMIGWNCADIQRCVNDVLRLLVANKGSNLQMLFDRCIKQIVEQYNLCGRCESTNLDENRCESYIS